MKSFSTFQTIAFIEHNVTLEGARVLDVGAGRGDVMEELERLKATVFAIDKSAKAIEKAKAEGRVVHEADICSISTDERFDVILFSMSAHHIHPLSQALDRARDLLKPGGHLLLEDFAVEDCDAESAAWYYESQALLTAFSLVEKSQWTRTQILADPLSIWQDEHSDEHHGFNTGKEMQALVADRFEIKKVERVPYFYRYLTSSADADTGVRLFTLEKTMISANKVRPLGLRIVAQ